MLKIMICDKKVGRKLLGFDSIQLYTTLVCYRNHALGCNDQNSPILHKVDSNLTTQNRGGWLSATQNKTCLNPWPFGLEGWCSTQQDSCEMILIPGRRVQLYQNHQENAPHYIIWLVLMQYNLHSKKDKIPN